MGKLACPCGNTISSVLWPNPAIGWLVTSIEADRMTEQISALDIHKSRTIWECANCGRLSVSYPDKDSHSVKWYSPDDGKPGHLCAESPPSE